MSENSIFGTPAYDQIKKLRDLIEGIQGETEYELCGLKPDQNGHLIGVFRKKDEGTSST